MSVDFNLRYLLPVSKLKEKVTDVEIVYKDDSMWLTSQIDGEKCTLLAKYDKEFDTIHGFTAYMGHGGIKLFEKLFHILKFPFMTEDDALEMYQKWQDLEEEYISKNVAEFGYACKYYDKQYMIAETKEELDKKIAAIEAEQAEKLNKISTDLPF